MRRWDLNILLSVGQGALNTQYVNVQVVVSNSKGLAPYTLMPLYLILKSRKAIPVRARPLGVGHSTLGVLHCHSTFVYARIKKALRVIVFSAGPLTV